MKLQLIKESENDFIPQLVKGSAIDAYYHFPHSDKLSYKNRSKVERHTHTEQLATIIKNYMNVNLTPNQEENIAHIKAGANVVIGGQQAGLFVSPMYTIHKIISIITLAKEQSKALGEPVVPVFWIAGEDHDFEEVNHAFIYNKNEHKMNKVNFKSYQVVTNGVSNVTMTDKEKETTIQALFEQLDETSRTKVLIEQLQALPNEWSEQFKLLINDWFKSSGLLIIDAANRELRQLEQSAFLWLLEHHEAVDKAFRAMQQQTSTLFGGPMIETNTNVHLFIEHEGSRELLHYDNDTYLIKDGTVTFTKAELRNIIEKTPERFSNNVVTRPLMQEFVFNTLAFIGGPAEIKYWAELKQVFELYGRPMPVVVPRMRITYVNKRIEKLIEKYNLDLKTLLTEGIHKTKKDYLLQDENVELLKHVEQFRATIVSSYQLMKKSCESDQVLKIVESNYKHQLKQVDYLKKHYKKEITSRNRVVLNHFFELESALNPRSGLQERTWHPLQLLNDIDLDLFDRVIDEIAYTTDLVVVYPTE